MKLRWITTLAIISTLFLSSCTKEDIGVSHLEIRLTDAPVDYNEVNIDLEQVQVKLDGALGFTSLTTNKGLYDLLKLTNGISAVIAQDSLPSGQQVQMIRLILGDSSNVVVDNVQYPLETPSAEESGLQINLNRILVQDSLNSVILDFDAAASIVAQGNGTYALTPVIRVVE